MTDDEVIAYDKQIIAWRDDCRANPNAHPSVERQISQLKIMPPTSGN
ncbi:hypothetical protein AB4Y42_18440 [Paraburkholderia sp. EG286B]